VEIESHFPDHPDVDRRGIRQIRISAFEEFGLLAVDSGNARAVTAEKRAAF
jgi:hypothetical protein